MTTCDHRIQSMLLILGLCSIGCDSRVAEAEEPETGMAGTSNVAAGGSGGAATLPVPNTRCAEVPSGGGDPLIDDVEDADSMVRAVDGRDGGWFVVNDKTGLQVPASAVMPEAGDGAEGSTSFVQTSGTDFVEWGAAVGLNFHGNPSCPYDASAFAGIRFFARGKSTISVQVSTAGTVPPAAGGDGSCQTPGGAPDQGCYATHRSDLALAADWAEYTLLWSDLVQPEWGTPAVFDPTRVIAVQWTVLEEQALDFEYSIDQVSFLSGGAP